MKATVEKYPDFETLKAAEKAQKDAVPEQPKVDLMQAFVAQFGEMAQEKTPKQASSKS